MDVKKNKKKSILKSGVGEILGFSIIVPFILLMIVCILSITQISLLSEKMSYSCYAAGRAAVVSEDAEKGVERAKAVLEEMYQRDVFVAFLEEDAEFDIPYLAPGQTFCVLQLVGDDAMWVKGDLLRCTVYQYTTPITPFTRGLRSQSIAMMIENGLE